MKKCHEAGGKATIYGYFGQSDCKFSDLDKMLTNCWDQDGNALDAPNVFSSQSITHKSYSDNDFYFELDLKLRFDRES